MILTPNDVDADSSSSYFSTFKKTVTDNIGKAASATTSLVVQTIRAHPKLLALGGISLALAGAVYLNAPAIQTALETYALASEQFYNSRLDTLHANFEAAGPAIEKYLRTFLIPSKSSIKKITKSLSAVYSAPTSLKKLKRLLSVVQSANSTDVAVRTYLRFSSAVLISTAAFSASIRILNFSRYLLNLPNQPRFPLINYLISLRKGPTILKQVARFAEEEDDSIFKKTNLFLLFLAEVGVGSDNIQDLQDLFEKFRTSINNIQNQKLKTDTVHSYTSISDDIRGIDELRDSRKIAKDNYIRLSDTLREIIKKEEVNSTFDKAPREIRNLPPYAITPPAKNKSLCYGEFGTNARTPDTENRFLDELFVSKKATVFFATATRNIQLTPQEKNERERFSMLEKLSIFIEEEDLTIPRRLEKLKNLINGIFPSIEKYEKAKKTTFYRVLDLMAPRFSSLSDLKKNAIKGLTDIDKILVQVYISIDSIVLDSQLKKDMRNLFDPLQSAHEIYSREIVKEDPVALESKFAHLKQEINKVFIFPRP